LPNFEAGSLKVTLPAVAAQVFTRFDTATGAFQSWSPGSRCFCEELIFVPGPDGARVEDDGALLGMVFDAETQTSSLVVRRLRWFSFILCVSYLRL
jgi:carotenoid cleavage dioxygenase-like enzyme